MMWSGGGVKRIKEFADTEDAEVVCICARIEEEISELDKEEKGEMAPQDIEAWLKLNKL